jgi:nicotinate-nucleotide--dimethylbenzimidazole phosphoribosyltransferase
VGARLVTEVLDHVVASIAPASAAHGEAAHRAVADAAAPPLARVARALGQAQHVSVPRVDRRILVVVAADLPAADPGIALGAGHPTVVAAGAIADGSAAVARLARIHATPVLLVDAGAREPDHMPAQAVRLAGLEAGIALAVSLSEAHDVVALGALGVGAELTAAAVLGATTGTGPVDLEDPEAELLGIRAAASVRQPALERLALFGGGDTAVMTGLILGLASVQIPVILDGYATVAAAVTASWLQPEVRAYAIAAQGGPPLLRKLLDCLEAVPVFAQGIGHGEGVGAAMVLPLLDQVAALSTRGYKGSG